MTTTDEKRLEKAIQHGEDAFWAVIAGAYPEATSGDLQPEVVHQLNMTMKAAAKCWIENNVPRPMTLGEFRASREYKRLEDLGIDSLDRLMVYGFVYSEHNHYICDNGAEGWHLIIERSEYIDHDLGKLEEILYRQWYLPNWYPEVGGGK